MVTSTSTYFPLIFQITYQTFLLFRRHLEFRGLLIHSLLFPNSDPKKNAQRFAKTTASTTTSAADSLISLHLITDPLITSSHHRLLIFCMQAHIKSATRAKVQLPAPSNSQLLPAGLPPLPGHGDQNHESHS